MFKVNNKKTRTTNDEYIWIYLALEKLVILLLTLNKQILATG